ncbi:S8 family serine peptidase [Bosea lathyri]|uniref:Serine protease, subtilisin family n=1 Tax=Bosea lathyri TaxID=1036778 RepID=A0A1H5ZD43_9HYPH|nr:S8 family serine peptidase [Bosea lathyri]SEG33276.1 Serine protease, subtilisin family [Bosea lathyri]
MPVRPNRDALPMSRLARLAGCGWLSLMLGVGAVPALAQTNMSGAGQGFGRNESLGRVQNPQSGRVQTVPATRPTTGGRYPPAQMPSGRPSRPRPGGGWGPAGIGLGAGIIGGILLDQAARRPVYDPYEPEPPRRVRRPIVVEEYYDDEEPALRRPRRPAPVREAAPPRRAAPPPARQAAGPAPRQPRVIVPPASENRFVAEEILFELAPNARAEIVLRRHRATLIASRRFELAGVNLIRARLNDGRSARIVLAQMAGDRNIASAQPNYIYSLQQDAPVQSADAPRSPDVAPAKPDLPVLTLSAPAASTIASPEPMPAPVAPKRELQPQYIVEKLHLDDVHKLARGEKIRVAVIDSGADIAHPELQGVVAGSFDALGGEVAPHAHGTAMAAAIMAQAQLQGVAPASRLLAARAFAGGTVPASASGTTFHILAALDWAAEQSARVVNLSFAGPQDRLLSRSLAGAKGRGMVAVAAAGNGGASAAPLYPGADPNVIAVTATDADDKAFPGANRGAYIAVAAPGVDVLAAEPQGRYAFSSGTSIAAAHVSGLVALLLEKRPDLDLEGIRKLLMDSAVDLGTKGRDPVFGAGRVDAPAALARALPVSAARP